MFKRYREESRNHWGAELDSSTNLSIEQINCGALLRIADATEKMAQSYQALIEDRDYYKKRHIECVQEIRSLKKSNSALRGQITKLKKKNAGDAEPVEGQQVQGL